ncbi:MAG: hypothetical protein KGZ43_08320 [Sulfuritalea sp.]|nr:hypothetical protein [Sulfuritalea sp.]
MPRTVAFLTGTIVAALSWAYAFAAPPDKGWGINLHGVRYWSPTLPFKDVFKQAGPWIPQRAGSDTWNTGEPIDLDATGWIRSLRPGQEAATVVLLGPHVPAGRYLLTYDGEGEIFVGLDGKIVDRDGRRLVVEVRPKNSLILKVLKTNPTDPLRNIRLAMPDEARGAETSPFNPAYLDYLRGFRVLRFMDWANANEKVSAEWAERTTIRHATQQQDRGVALEYMIDLAATLEANPWFNVPHAASDHYVRNMARLIRTRLPRQLKFYLEYSNEVWNGMFPQHQYAAQEAARHGLRDADEFYLQRSLQIFRIFAEEFGGSDRFVRVLGGQAVHLHRAGRLLSRPGLANGIDAYAIAPYFGHDLHRAAQPGSNPDTLMALLAEDLEKTRRVIRANVELARKAGVVLIAYEGGQHVTNPPDKKDFCLAANRHPQMEALYARYMDIWEEETQGALMVLFADMSTYGQFGCWGLSEFHGQSLQAAPKLRAVRERTLRLKHHSGPSGSRP